ncbi:MAG: alpha/beta fold hydrolase [Alphaproteobacteria bacterium]|nr:alpha/beta fold hydrolase [Alphaproteobacteria bacterium]MBV9554908.1 alpha/beta fold hydrolase [Alphaproteobacteria bacterium]
MPVTHVRGVDIRYEILGDRGPFIALQPGGRRGLVGVKPLGEKIAEAGFRVIVYDRRNTGASSVKIEGDSENEVWADDLHALLGQLDALPAYVGGSSSGCRLAMVMTLRHPEAVRGLLLWRVTGGQYAAQHLANQYYTSHIDAATRGGMAAVCAMEHWSEVIAANPASREALIAMEAQDFIARMTRWRDSFNAGSEQAVIGLSPADLRAMTVPACVIPGNDRVHPRYPGQAAHRLMPNSEYHEVFAEDRMDVDVAFEDWEKKEGLLAALFIDFLRRQQRR